ncbi:hypothetical protein BCR44DRAFT_1428104 [Catenaria anguillulae PL171]|uniref:Invertebrate defensins family profile domain-containing protein n=1 Tax=Catenaria anguillulae PL171 TaxID=765915 RepID=A0A1Y2HYY6_9FUNG|nr:hypothetical protein BCR44DRAFT_1428104 [Catenaria anguillulae PL171]
MQSGERFSLERLRWRWLSEIRLQYNRSLCLSACLFMNECGGYCLGQQPIRPETACVMQ